MARQKHVPVNAASFGGGPAPGAGPGPVLQSGARHRVSGVGQPGADADPGQFLMTAGQTAEHRTGGLGRIVREKPVQNGTQTVRKLAQSDG